MIDQGCDTPPSTDINHENKWICIRTIKQQHLKYAEAIVERAIRARFLISHFTDMDPDSERIQAQEVSKTDSW
jgi:hypothetical protein